MEADVKRQTETVATPRYGLSASVGAWFSRHGPAVSVALVFAAVALRLVRIVHGYAVNIFFSDHWGIEDSTLFHHHSWLEIFRWQHGFHRQGLGGILLALFEPVTSWDERADAYLVVGILVCACVSALWLKRRLFGELTYWDSIIPLLFFTPTQYETLLGSLNPAYAPLPTLLLVLFCLAWTISQERWRHGALLVVNGLAIYTGYGLLLGFLTPLLFSVEFLRSRNLLALTSALLNAAVLASFFVGHQPVPTVCPYSGFTDYAAFLIGLFSLFAQLPRQWTALAIVVGSGLTYGIALVTLSQVVTMFREWSSRNIVVTTLLSYSVLFIAGSTFARSCPEAGASSRYMSYLLIAFMGLYLAALSRPHGERRALLTCVLSVSLFSSILVGPQLHESIARISIRQQGWRRCYMASRDIGACDSIYGPFIDTSPEPKDLQQKLDYLERHELNLFR